MVDPYYADRYSRVMMSDEKYKLIEQKSHDQRKIGYLEEQNTTLQAQNNQFIDSIAMSYRRYTENAEKNGEEPISLKAFIIDIFGLELPDEIIDKIPTK